MIGSAGVQELEELRSLLWEHHLKSSSSMRLELLLRPNAELDPRETGLISSKESTWERIDSRLEDCGARGCEVLLRITLALTARLIGPRP